MLTFSNSTSAGSGIASVLEGQVAQFQRFDVYSQTAANRQKRGGFYAQDSWRVTPKLTLNYGVRWDIIFPETVNSPGNGGFTDLSAGVIRVAGVGGIGTNGNAKVDLLDLGAASALPIRFALTLLSAELSARYTTTWASSEPSLVLR